jgi:hypothetical protein
MRRLLRRAVLAFAYTAAALISLALLALIYAFIINCRDESLMPQAQALLAEPPHTVHPEDNLYVALMGFQAPAGESPATAGQHRIERYNAALDGMLIDPDRAAAFNAADQPAKLECKCDSKLWSPLTTSLWETAKTHRVDLQQAKLANAVLFDRYRALHAFRAYDETARPSLQWPIGLVPPTLRTLYLADIAARFQIGSTAQQHEALQDLAADIALWRMVLTSQKTLLSTMITSATLRADELLLADLIADPATDLTKSDSDLKALVRPFETADWRLDKTFAAEYRATDAVLRPEVLSHMPIDATSASPLRWFKQQWNALGMHFFKLHATENLRAEQIAHDIALSTVDLEHYTSQLTSYRDWASHDQAVHRLAVLYNPMGRLLTSIARGAYGDYQTRLFDTAALQRLPICTFEIRTQHVTAHAVPAFLTQHPEWCSHVIPGHPFHWNPDTHELTVEPLGEGNNPTHRKGVTLRFLWRVLRRSQLVPPSPPSPPLAAKICASQRHVT